MVLTPWFQEEISNIYKKHFYPRFSLCFVVMLLFNITLVKVIVGLFFSLGLPNILTRGLLRVFTENVSKKLSKTKLLYRFEYYCAVEGE
jgi:hypothetical protein